MVMTLIPQLTTLTFILLEIGLLVGGLSLRVLLQHNLYLHRGLLFLLYFMGLP
jgi:hypothetical protein